MWLWLVGKLPVLNKVGAFLTSGKFLGFLALILVSLFVFTKATTVVQSYVDTKVEVATKSLEVEGLKEQVKTMKANQEIITRVTKETRVIQIQQQNKAEKIEEKINEEIKNGNDGFVPSITSSTLDSL